MAALPGVLDVVVRLGAVLLLVLLNGFFVAAEFALVKVRRRQLDLVPDSLRRRAAYHLLDHLDAYLSACQLGITIASLALGWIAEPALADLVVAPLLGGLVTSETALHAIAFTIAFTLVTAMHIVVGEQAPKFLGIRKPRGTALFVALPLQWFRRLFAPLIWVLNASADALVRALGIEKPKEEAAEEFTMDELRVLLAQSPAGSQAERRSAQVASLVLDLQRRRVQDAMVPRERIVYLDLRRPFEDNAAILRGHRFTRYPLCDGDLDSVVGFVNYRDVFAALSRGETVQLGDLRRGILPVRPDQVLSNVLFTMIERRRLFAVVVDEMGHTQGLLTIEDILEEFVGDLPSEHGQLEARLRVAEPGRYIVDASLGIDELRAALRTHIDGAGAINLGQLVSRKVGRRTKPGDRFIIGDYEFEVREVGSGGPRTIEVRQNRGP